MTYSCTKYHEQIKDKFKRLPMPQMDDAIAAQAKPYFYVLSRDWSPAKPSSENLMLSGNFDQALDSIVENSEDDTEDSKEELHKWLSSWQDPANLTYPYLQLYHQRHLLTGQEIDLAQQHHLTEMDHYLEHRLGPEYAEAEMLFQAGMVSQKHWQKLFRPGAVVVTYKADQPVAYVSASYPNVENNVLHSICWTWAFDGKFYQDKVTLTVPWPSDADMVIITDLDVYPLQYSDTGLEQELRRRGEIFWTCRQRKFVNYTVPSPGMEAQAVGSLPWSHNVIH
jgi:hypothetical protein